MSKKVTFTVSTEYAGSKIEETFTLKDLGIDENLDEKELEKEVQEAFEDWVWENIDTSWSIED